MCSAGAIAIGVGIGYFHPQTGAALKPLGDAFIQLIKMRSARSFSAPWCTVSLDARHGEGRPVGVKAWCIRVVRRWLSPSA